MAQARGPGSKLYSRTAACGGWLSLQLPAAGYCICTLVSPMPANAEGLGLPSEVGMGCTLAGVAFQFIPNELNCILRQNLCQMRPECVTIKLPNEGSFPGACQDTWRQSNRGKIPLIQALRPVPKPLHLISQIGSFAYSSNPVLASRNPS